MATATITHVFNDNDNVNISLSSSNLGEVGVQALSLGATGGGNTRDQKHYRLTFNVPNITISDKNFVSFSTGSETASNPPSGVAPEDGVTSGLSFTSYHELDGDNQIRVWFSTNGSNSFVRTITVTYSENSGDTPGSAGCTDGPWTPALPPSGCPSLPSSGSGGSNALLLTQNGSSGVTVDLRNYPNKLVTLELSGTFGGSSWANSCTVVAPNSSDILVGGSPVSGAPYSKANLTQSSSFNAKIYNIDGGSSFTISSSSTDGTQPSRIKRTEVCTTSAPDSSGNTTTTCTCVEETEYYTPWLPCTKGVQIGTSSGSTVTWGYTDGNGGSTPAQLFTLKVLSTKDVLPFTGAVGMEDVQNYCWVTPSDDAYLDLALDDNGEPGHSAGDYYRHPDKERFRSPSEQASRTNINAGGIIYNEFRGVAGAEPPS